MTLCHSDQSKRCVAFLRIWGLSDCWSVISVTSTRVMWVKHLGIFLYENLSLIIISVRGIFFRESYWIIPSASFEARRFLSDRLGWISLGWSSDEFFDWFFDWLSSKWKFFSIWSSAFTSSSLTESKFSMRRSDDTTLFLVVLISARRLLLVIVLES